MSGIYLGGMGGVRASAGNGFNTAGSGATATQMAFGTGGATVAGSPSTASAIAPNDPFGVAFTTAVFALVVLLVIRHALPA